MSVKLVFQDEKGIPLHDEDILYDGLAPLPVPNELVHLPGGERITVVSRQMAYVNSHPGITDVQIIFVCRKHTTVMHPLKRS
jgi:hypothetical protein